MTVRGLAWHRLAILLASLALAVRMMVPAGFMPMSGSVALMLCPGQNAIQPAATMHGMHHGDGEHNEGDSQPSCPFAAAASAIDLATPQLVIALPPLAPAVTVVVSFLTAPGLGLAAPPPPKTGPPSLG